MTDGQPTLAGVLLPRPSTWTRTPVPVESAVTLADGSESTYHLGHRMVFDLSWELAADQLASTVERLGMFVGPTEYVDIDGTSYVVTVADRQPRQAVRGTDPVRYQVGLSLQEHTPRQVPAPDPDIESTAPVGPVVPIAVVSPADPNVLLVSAGAVDPADPAVLVWAV